MRFTAALFAAVAPVAVLAHVVIPWSFKQAPPKGLKDVTFGVNMARAAHAPGYFFAVQLRFYGNENLAHIGLQPRQDKDGKSIIHATFSSSEDGAKTNNKNCRKFTDRGPGVSCALEIEGDYSHPWNLTIKKSGGSRWRGFLTDGATGIRRQIGSFILPEDGLIKSSENAFVEYYPWNAVGNTNCPRQPFVDVSFAYPYTRTAGASAGSLDVPTEFGNCKGEVDFNTSLIFDGHNIQFGKLGRPIIDAPRRDFGG